MLLARVEGYATATIKHASLDGWKLLVIHPLRSLTHEPLIALDPIGAAIGDLVVISSDGDSARQLVDDETSPIRWSILGIVEQRGADPSPGTETTP